MIIGLSGYARSGKDEAAKVLVEKHGFVRVAFADKLREVLYALDPLIGIEGEPYEGGLDFITVQMVIDKFGWDGYKETPFGPEIRRLLQRLGTEAGRQTLWDSIWVDAAFAGVDAENIVVTDMRFPNEAQAIVDRNGITVRVNRDGVGPAVGANGVVHPSETSLDDWDFDYHLLNNGGLEEYHQTVDDLVRVVRTSP